MDRFLLNSNNRSESENKEGTLSTSGKNVKERKNWKYGNCFDLGFTSREVDGEERPQCVLHIKVLASESMLPSKWKRHLEITHPSVMISLGFEPATLRFVGHYVPSLEQEFLLFIYCFFTIYSRYKESI
jgi:hypothetical protein